jgi:coenzyme F420-reducing hydrogenase alpha subunit
MNKTISIDPNTRLEGHGKITIFLKKEGTVEKRALWRAQHTVQEVKCLFKSKCMVMKRNY